MRIQSAEEHVTFADDLVIAGDNLTVLSALPESHFDLIYMDPPFNTGRVQVRRAMRTQRSETGGRVGFHGLTYENVRGKITSYDDVFADYGADTLRLFEMSAGPLEADRPWETKAIVGPFRLLQRIWRVV